ncbi:MAG: AGE family epimerase/isomerase [Lachnospiraceae bacterium]|nr:AGE family epimerase/isomerase [Lachnospiraceae bacterium]
MAMLEEVRQELTGHIIPFWLKLKDEEYGGYYGLLDFDLKLDTKAEKGCILNNRIIWFFSAAYVLLKDPELLSAARHAYDFLRKYCLDREYGGVYWSMSYDGKPLDTTKHTYNQAFCIYALSAYYEASGDKEALEEAYKLFEVIEGKCRDEGGYLEAYDRKFEPASNEKLSENGVMATRTMNTLLHVFEAYTELYRVDKDPRVAERLYWILDCFADKIYNPALRRQEVFFDHEYNTLIDLYSYGHDIETSWLIDRGLEVLGEKEDNRLYGITRILAQNVKKEAFDGHSMANECERGIVNADRIWWVQAETVVGFINAYQKDTEQVGFLEGARAEWEFIREHVVDSRPGSEWYNAVTAAGQPDPLKRPIVEPWKCPYHNGRMCIEVLRRGVE